MNRESKVPMGGAGPAGQGHVDAFRGARAEIVGRAVSVVGEPCPTFDGSRYQQLVELIRKKEDRMDVRDPNRERSCS